MYTDRGRGTVAKEGYLLRRGPGTVAIFAGDVMNKHEVDTIAPCLLYDGFYKEVIFVFWRAPDFIRKPFTPKKGGHSCVVKLVKQVTDLNQNKYFDEFFEKDYTADFCVGVAFLSRKAPPKAPNQEKDLYHLKKNRSGRRLYHHSNIFLQQKIF